MRKIKTMADVERAQRRNNINASRGDRWQVAGGRWQVAGGRWQVAGGRFNSIKNYGLRHTISYRHLVNCGDME